MKFPYLPVLTVITLGACSDVPVEVPYDRVNCDFCRMSITDRRFGAELVSSKGKAYFFDALECQVNFRLNNTSETWRHSLATPFLHPGELYPTDSLVILRSTNGPSPMGMNLTSWLDEEEATFIESAEGDALFTYPELLEQWHVVEQR